MKGEKHFKNTLHIQRKLNHYSVTILLHPLFLICSFLYIVNQLIERVYHIHLPIVHAYLDDVLCMPVVLTVTLAAMQKLYGKPDMCLSRNQVIGTVLYFALVLEITLPYYAPGIYTADSLDVLFYGIGAFAFYYIIQRKEKNVTS